MDNEQQKSKRSTLILVSVAVYAVLALLFIIIINSAAISKWLSNMLSVLAPLIVGAAMAYLSNPLLVMFERRVFKKMRSRGSKRALSMVCTYLVLLIVLVAILGIIVPQLISSYNSFASSLRSYTDKAITFVNKLIYSLNSSLSEDRDMSKYIDIGDIQRKVSELFNSSSSIFSTVASYVVSYASSIAVGVKNVLFGLFISIYILCSKERLAAQSKKILTAILPEHRYSVFVEWMRFSNSTFGNYIKAQLLDALLVAVECAILLSATGMPYPVLLAFIIGVTNIIPIFGPFIGGIPAGFIVFISAPEKLLLFIFMLILIQQIDGHFILPKLVGTTTGISSLGVLCAITVMGGYFGIVGMILGVPVFVVTGEIIRRLVNIKLERRGLSVSLEDYYLSGTAPIGGEKKHDNFIVRALRAIGRLFARVGSAIAGFFRWIFKRK